jgi:hypothetical protein
LLITSKASLQIVSATSDVHAVEKHMTELIKECNEKQQRKSDITNKKMACSKMISFAEILHGRDVFVRVTNDHLLYAVDLAMVGTGHSRNDAAQV